MEISIGDIADYDIELGKIRGDQLKTDILSIRDQTSRFALLADLLYKSIISISKSISHQSLFGYISGV